MQWLWATACTFVFKPMKLNLLPTHVSKEGQTKIAVIMTSVLSLAAIGAAIAAVAYSNNELTLAKQRDEEAKPAYDKVVAISKQADDIMAGSVVIDRNVKLANAMMAHNGVYPALYREVLSYCPSFFRVNSIVAVPNGQATTVTMTGVIQSYQQYADIMLAMLRIKDATNVTRAGYADTRPIVPSLNEQDQAGLPVRPGEQNLPSNPQDRLEALVARASAAPTGFQGVGGFGTVTDTKGAMPDWSQITVTVTLNRNIQTPNPRATLTSQGGATTVPAGGSGTGFTPPNPGGRGGGPNRD